MTERELHEIDDYLAGNPDRDFVTLSAGMNAAEREALKVAITEQQELQLAVGAAAIREKLARLHAGAATPGAPASADSAPVATAERGIGRSLRLVAIAGLVFFALLIYTTQCTGDRAPYADYEFQDPGLPLVMGLADDPTFAAAMTQFRRGDFAAANSAFAAIATPANDTLTYYRGASAYYAADYARAIPELLTVTEDSRSLFRQRAEYLLALSYLKDDSQREGKLLLEKIHATPNHRFAGSARRLLTEEIE